MIISLYVLLYCYINNYDIDKYHQQQKQTKKLSPCFSAQFVLVTTTKKETLRFL